MNGKVNPFSQHGKHLLPNAYKAKGNHYYKLMYVRSESIHFIYV